MSNAWALHAPIVSLFCALTTVGLASAQTPDQLPEITVTATRNSLEIQRAGSAVDVINRDDIERLGATGVRDVLQSVPGLYIHGSGGVGSVTNLTLRGATSGQTMILVDGVRLSDPSSTDNAADLGGLVLGEIDRIEIVRGPQSALYGSEAMGGVVQIFTRRGDGPPRKSVTLDGGSYGTLHARGSVSGGDDRIFYSLSVDSLHSDGFARYGYRSNHPILMTDGVTPLPALPGTNPTNRTGLNGRVGYRLGDSNEVEFGASGSVNKLAIDNPYAFMPANVFSNFNQSTSWAGRAYVKLTNRMFDDRLKNQLTIFTSDVDNSIAQTESCPEDFISNCRTIYRGQRFGGEYQGDFAWGALGATTAGVRYETERANQAHDLPVNLGGGRVVDFKGEQTTRSAFALHQITLADRLDLSVAGRVDSVDGGPSFATGRGTIAWRIPGPFGKLRASYGSGAKIPSLYQRFGPYGQAALTPEQSTGYDVGYDQSLFDDRVRLSATYFDNQFKSLIDFTFNAAACPPLDFFGCYFNVGRAATRGVELAAKFDIVPATWRVDATYTYMDAINRVTAQGLLQRPRHKAVGALVFTGVANLRLEGRLTVVGGVLDFGTIAPVRLPAYYKIDAYADYRVNDAISLFARIENLTDARYEEVYNYGVAGRSYFAGLKVDW